MWYNEILLLAAKLNLGDQKAKEMAEKEKQRAAAEKAEADAKRRAEALAKAEEDRKAREEARKAGNLDQQLAEINKQIAPIEKKLEDEITRLRSLPDFWVNGVVDLATDEGFKIEAFRDAINAFRDEWLVENKTTLYGDGADIKGLYREKEEVQAKINVAKKKADAEAKRKADEAAAIKKAKEE